MSERKWLDDATTEQIERWITERKDKVRDLESQLKDEEEVVSVYQTELDRRALAAYWEAHPELLRLEVGDKVVITREHQVDYERSIRQSPSTKEGEVYQIKYINVYEGAPDSIGLEGKGGRIPYRIAVGMRRAYLAQQQET